MNGFLGLYCLFSLTFLINEIHLSSQVSFLEDVTLTREQKIQLDEFRTLVGPSLPHDYMQEDIYLVRWLRARNFNIQNAKTMLMQNIKWRKETNMDNILNEDWTDFNRDYRYTIEGCDIEGRPVISMFVGDWDVRKAVIAGQSQKMMRYVDKLFEEMTVFVRRAQKQGQNVTQYSELYEMSHYNIRQQGCALCLPIYFYIFQSYENHYPGTAHKTFLLNTPAVFESVFQLVKPLISDQTRSTLFLFGRDKKEWMPIILKEMDINELTWEFGGTREVPIDIDDIRTQVNGTFQCAAVN